MSKKPTVTAGSGNVFADIGLPDADGELFKAELTDQIAKRIKALALTQSQAGARLGLSQPDVPRLTKWRRSGFSTDRLLALLSISSCVQPIPRSRSLASALRNGFSNAVCPGDRASRIGSHQDVRAPCDIVSGSCHYPSNFALRGDRNDKRNHGLGPHTVPPA